jgi:TPR repeat protein
VTVDEGYIVLQLPPTASWREVRYAYRRMALLHHPDRPRPTRRSESEAAFRRCAEAYRVLREEEIRRRHGTVPPSTRRGRGASGGAPPLSCLLCGQPYPYDPAEFVTPAQTGEGYCPECGNRVAAGSTELERVVLDEPERTVATRRPRALKPMISAAAVIAIIVATGLLMWKGVRATREENEHNRATVLALAGEAEQLAQSGRDQEAIDRLSELCRVAASVDIDDDETARRTIAEAHLALAERASFLALLDQVAAAGKLADKGGYDEAMRKYADVVSAARAHPGNPLARNLATRTADLIAEVSARQQQRDARNRRAQAELQALVEAQSRRSSESRALVERAATVLEGGGSDDDLAKAVVWLFDAAKLGDARAMYTIGKLFQDGIQVVGRAGEPVRWYPAVPRAPTQFDATQSLAVPGSSAAWTRVEAAKWYQKAANLGHVDAMNELGALYASGEGVPQDGTRAVEWLSKAAANGHAAAQRNLGMLYESGKVVPRDLDQAAHWYEQAARNADPEAIQRLSILHRGT